MHATYSVAKDRNYGSKQTPRKTLVHCSGSASMENSAKVLGTTTNSDSERSKFLSNRNKIKPTFTGRIEVVEREFTSSEQQATENRNTTVGRKSVWVGGNPVRKALWGIWSYQERTKHINVPELIAVKLAILTFT